MVYAAHYLLRMKNFLMIFSRPYCLLAEGCQDTVDTI